MSETYALKPFQQKAYNELCKLSIAFHNAQPLEDMQQDLWEMLKAALEPSDSLCQDGFMSSNMLYLYEQLEAVITAVYGLAADPFEDKKTKKKKKKKTAS
jgi:hypothetical protein